MKRRMRKKPTEYTIRVIQAGTDEECRRTLAEARRWFMTRYLEHLRRQRGDHVC